MKNFLIFKNSRFSGGLGDMFRSMLAFYTFCKIHDIYFNVFFTPNFRKYFSCSNYDYIVNTQYFYSNHSTEFDIFLENLKTKSDGIFIVSSNLFRFVEIEDMNKYKYEFLEFLGYKGSFLKTDICLHVRCGDAFMKNVNVGSDKRLNPISIKNEIKNYIEGKDNITIITDNSFIKFYFSNITTNTNINHTALANTSEEDVGHALYDFFTLMNANKIVAFSPSGFSFWASFFGNVPIVNEKEEPITLRSF